MTPVRGEGLEGKRMKQKPNPANSDTDDIMAIASEERGSGREE